MAPESDGYTEAWYLPDADNINVWMIRRQARGNRSWVCEGTLANLIDGINTGSGKATFTYTNDQPSTTLWYHDHSLGLTRLNVYAAGAGFWLIREPGGGEDGVDETRQTLPGPAPALGEDPNFDPAVRAKIREIPIAIQDKAFNTDGSLFYPANRAFFEGLGDGQTYDQNAADGLRYPLPAGPGLGHLAGVEPGGVLQRHGGERQHLARSSMSPRSATACACSMPRTRAS